MNFRALPNIEMDTKYSLIEENCLPFVVYPMNPSLMFNNRPVESVTKPLLPPTGFLFTHIYT